MKQFKAEKDSPKSINTSIEYLNG